MVVLIDSSGRQVGGRSQPGVVGAIRFLCSQLFQRPDPLVKSGSSRLFCHPQWL